jgi:DNA polymerase-3 subunit epsilon
VVELGLVKLYPDGRRTAWSSLFNPGIPIPPEATAVHGISDAEVAEAQPFSHWAKALTVGLTGCDIAGYNVRFDVAFLFEEFKRCRIVRPDLLDGRRIDACTIFHRAEPRDLSAAVRRYLGREHGGAHRALTDAQATLAVLEAQLAAHDLPRDVEGLDAMLNTVPEGCVDPAGKVVWRYGEATLAFGQKAGTKLRDLDRGFMEWVVRSDFAEATKKVFRDALEGRFPTK